jgi:hypothetical protein
MGTQVSKKSSSAHQRPSSIRKFDLTHFAVITVIFNPMRYHTRYELYQKFQAHIARAGVTLLTVECIFDIEKDLGLPKQKFQVTQPGNPLHRQIKAPSVLWLKENLINIAVQYLSMDIEYLAWLDADVEFEVRAKRCAIPRRFFSFSPFDRLAFRLASVDH